MEEITTPSSQPHKQSKQSKALMWVMLAALIVALAVIGWLIWMMINWNAERAALVTEKQQLTQQIAELNEQLTLAKADSDTPPTPACSPEISAAFKENIQAAIESHNYAALAPSMAATVSVIIAASEGVGDRTPDQAVTDMAYLNGGAAPWNFALPAATIAAWEAGFYTNYFDANTVVGKAADGMVVAIDFNDCGKINKVFMVAHEDLLAS